MDTLIYISFSYIFTISKGSPSVTNVALHKPADQSSVYGGFNASRAVDGNTNNTAKMVFNSCSHTSDSNGITEAWWKVNLEQRYTITTVRISYRHWVLPNHDPPTSAGRLAGFSIYISNTTDWRNGVLCYHDDQTPPRDITSPFIVLCFQTIHGQYLTISNERNSTFKRPGYSKSAILELCEVIIDIPSPCSNCAKTKYPFCGKNGSHCIYGCENGHYGNDCSQDCTCHGNGSCYRNGTCKSCDPGHYASRKKCVECDQSCRNKTCDKSGKCLSCDTGKYITGTMCVNCSTNCGGDKHECNQTDGSCIHGCKPGFFGRFCEDHCLSNCSKCDDGTTCETCRLGFYGPVCEKRCDGCTDLSCHRNGSCTTSCIAGRYGDMCSLHCTYTCFDNICNKDTGQCSEGCINTTYGEFCNMSCPTTCGGVTKSCNRVSGSCDSCHDGHYGDTCTSNCSSYCGGNGACELRTGTCKQGCVANKAGSSCDQENPIKDGISAGLIGGGIASVAAVLFVIIIVIVVLKRKTKKGDPISQIKSAYATEKENVYLNVGINNEGCSSMDGTTIGAEVNKTSVFKSSPKITKKSVKTDSSRDKADYYNSSNDYYTTGDIMGGGIAWEDFKEYVISKIGDESLLKEFDSIPYGELHPVAAGKKDVNKDKNRFKTTFPYDKTRVTLTATKYASDYINANYIHGRTKEKKYIATQGPLKNTIGDFWTMVWQCNVGKIVMLTGLIEGGKNKCKKYWPDVNESETHGGFILSIVDERAYSYYTQREIKIEETKSKQARRIHHFHFTAWPDHDVTDPVLLVQFHKRVQSKKSEQDGPLLVHCSAGIGRTGTYIGLNDLVQTAKDTNRINVKDFVKKMRECRMNMVQKAPQYVLLHEAILEELQLPETTITMADFAAEWSKIVSDIKPINQQNLRKEFEKVNEMKRIYTTKDFSESNLTQNKRKSRSNTSLPLDRYRPYLMRYVQERTDYINAVIIPSHKSVSGFIVTQAPLSETVIDFWRLIHDHEITTIVNFDSDHKEKCEFFPKADNEIKNEVFSIKSMSECKYEEEVSEREVALCEKGVEEKKIIKFVSVDLKSAKTPSCIQLIKVANLVNNWQHGNNTGPCVVVSFDGTWCCDVFCAMMIAMESLIVDNEVNIFQIVHQLQIRRPEFFPDCDTYKLCYEVINQHLTSENIYFN